MELDIEQTAITFSTTSAIAVTLMKGPARVCRSVEATFVIACRDSLEEQYTHYSLSGKCNKQMHKYVMSAHTKTLCIHMLMQYKG